MAAEYTQALLQTVEAGQNVLLSDTAVSGNRCIRHRQGSGIVTLKAGNNQCRALYAVSYGANISIPTGGTVGEISLALAIDGEQVASTRRRITPAAVNTFGNVSADAIVEVPCGCCVTVSIRNTSVETINVSEANLVIERIA